MEKILKLISEIPPSVNNDYLKPNAFIMWISGKPTAKVSMYETSESKQFKNNFIRYIKQQCSIQNWDITPNKYQHFFIDCTFYFSRIDMDANNYMKILLDAITDSQKIWIDDNVTLERVQGIYYDSKNPRIEIEIKPVDYIGVFQNKNALNNFINNCEQCTRHRNGRCSILIKAQEGRIQDEVNNELICLSFKKSKHSESKEDIL